MSKLFSIITVVVLAAILAAQAAAGTSHGFRDPRAPKEAAAILNRLPNVDGARCHWKIRMHTIGCVASVAGAHAQLFLWSAGKYVRYDVCASGYCSKAIRAKHVFGRPY